MANNSNRKLLQLIHKNMNGLRNIGPHSNAPYKCVVDRSSFDNMEDDDPLPTQDWMIHAKVFPRRTAVYNNRPVLIEIKLPKSYPGIPPEVRILSKVYHPNVDQTGKLCIPKIFAGSQYEPNMTLVQVIEEVTKALDEPSTDMVQHNEAGILRSTDAAQYEAAARQVFQQNP